MLTMRNGLRSILHDDDALLTVLRGLDDARLAAVLAMARDERATRAMANPDGWDDAGRWELGARPAAAVYASDQAYRAMRDPLADGSPS